MKIKVKITDKKHPHHGEYGWITNKTIRIFDGEKMLKVQLENCPAGIDSCFVSKGQLRLVIDP